MQRDYRLSCSRRARDPCRAVVVALNPLSLGRMKKNRPFVPRIGKSALKFLRVIHYPKPAQRIRMSKRIGSSGSGLRLLRFASCSKFEECLACFAWQMIRQRENVVFRGLLHVGEPFQGNAIAQQNVVAQMREERRLRWLWTLNLHIDRNSNFLDTLANFNQLSCASLRMCLKFAPFGPRIGFVVM